MTHGTSIELSLLLSRSNDQPSTRQGMRSPRVPRPKVRAEIVENDRH